MIMKASQRGGGQNLAAHLMRMDENEHVEIHEIRGFVAEDLHGAFKEAYAVSKGTKCRQYLFSMSLNPPVTEDVGIEVFENSIERAEADLGLENQPRVIVFHEKEGRRHAHVVWSRIDPETMTAKQMSFFKSKLTDLTREIFIEQNWKMPRGLANPAERDPRNFTLEEWQKAKRAGKDPRAMKEAVQNAWAISDTKEGFKHALQEYGYHLAKGDRRGHVILDSDGEIYALARTLGKKTRDIRARLGEADTLPSVNKTKSIIAETMLPVMKRHIEHAKDMYERKQVTLDEKRLAIRDSHRKKRKELSNKLSERRIKEAKARQKKLPKGLRGLWARVTGKYQKLKKENEADAQKCAKRDRAEQNKMVAAQLGERRRLQVTIQDQRNMQAELLRSLRSDTQRFSRMEKTPERPRDPAIVRGLSRER